MNIITDLDNLREPCEPITFLGKDGLHTEECCEIINKLKLAMGENSDILALSAPQIGVKKRIFCLRFNDQLKFFINPIITKKNGVKIVVETCASLPDKEIIIGRPEEIMVIYYNEEFKYEDNKLVDIAASLFDQQAQLLDGVLPTELGLVSDINEDGKITDEDLIDIIPFYKDSFLPSKLSNLVEHISQDESALKDFSKLKFTEGVINGRIKVVESEQDTKRSIQAQKVANKSMLYLNKAKEAENKALFKKHINKIVNKKHGGR